MAAAAVGRSEETGDDKGASGTNGRAQGQQKAVVELLATKITGTVKWFNVKNGYGFINRSDTKEDVFVHQSAIIKNNPNQVVRSLGDGEEVEFNVVQGEKGNEATNVTGLNGEAVRGSPYAAVGRRLGRFYGRGGRRRGSVNKGDDEGIEPASAGRGGRPFRGGRGGRFPSRFRGRGRGNNNGGTSGASSSEDNVPASQDEGENRGGEGEGNGRGSRGRGGRRGRGRFNRGGRGRGGPDGNRGSGDQGTPSMDDEKKNQETQDGRVLVVTNIEKKIAILKV